MHVHTHVYCAHADTTRAQLERTASTRGLSRLLADLGLAFASLASAAELPKDKGKRHPERLPDRKA